MWKKIVNILKAFYSDMVTGGGACALVTTPRKLHFTIQLSPQDVFKISQRK